MPWYNSALLPVPQGFNDAYSHRKESILDGLRNNVLVKEQGGVLLKDVARQFKMSIKEAVRLLQKIQDEGLIQFHKDRWILTDNKDI